MSLLPSGPAAAAFRAWLEQRVQPIDPPPDGFDPLDQGNADALEAYSLPARPDPVRMPALHAHWRELLSGPDGGSLRILRPALTDDIEAFLPRPACAKRAPGRPGQRPPGPTVDDCNWSGALVLPVLGDRLVQAVGRWRTPMASPGTGPNPAELPHRCSVWVGLDGGSRRSRHMPQVGTVHTRRADGGEPGVAGFWIEWWVKDVWSPPLAVQNLAVRPGDVVLCSVMAITPTRARFHLKNQASGILMSVEAEAPGVRDGRLSIDDPLEIDGETAEWILERPTDPHTERLFPLPDFGAVVFDHCAACGAPRPGLEGREMLPRGARLMRMTQRLDGPRRIALVSKPRKTGRSQVRIEYRPPV